MKSSFSFHVLAVALLVFSISFDTLVLGQNKPCLTPIIHLPNECTIDECAQTCITYHGANTIGCCLDGDKFLCCCKDVSSRW
ncbi:hypothetical protein ACOSP7_007968 [Xanthoceras sorbifolium]